MNKHEIDKADLISLKDAEEAAAKETEDRLPSANLFNDIFITHLDNDIDIEHLNQSLLAFYRELTKRFEGISAGNVGVKKIADQITISYSLSHGEGKMTGFEWAATEQELLASDHPVTYFLSEHLQEALRTVGAQ